MIALYVHPKNSIATMALDHSRLGLENKLLETKSGRIFCVRQVYFAKSCQQVWGRVNQPFILFTASHLMWNSTMRRCFYHTNLGQNAVFHNFAIQIVLIQYFGRSNRSTRGLLAKPLTKFPKSSLRLAGSHFWQAPKSTV